VIRDVRHAPLDRDHVSGVVSRNHVAPRVLVKEKEKTDGWGILKKMICRGRAWAVVGYLWVVPVRLQVIVGLHATWPHVADAHSRFSKRPVPRVVASRRPDVWHWFRYDGGGVNLISRLL
jgi:hypothetical protein